MGKSTVAGMFSEKGVPVLESDLVVHDLYSSGGDGVGPISQLLPDVIRDGRVDRLRLAELVRQDPKLLKQVESVIHPLVRHAQEGFVSATQAVGAPFVIVDVPLLFETDRVGDFDKIIVVSAPLELQRERALKRPNMTVEKLDFILSRQTPDDEKRRRADYIVDTSQSLDDTRAHVGRIICQLLNPPREADHA